MSKSNSQQSTPPLTRVVTDRNFAAEVIVAELPVVLEMWAPWCEACKQYSSVLEEVVGGFAGEIVLARANLDDCPSLLKRLGISMIPTAILFVSGREKSRIQGVHSAGDLTAFIKSVVEGYGATE